MIKKLADGDGKLREAAVFLKDRAGSWRFLVWNGIRQNPNSKPEPVAPGRPG